ncbi:hypothetical protein [Paenimyroides ceti]
MKIGEKLPQDIAEFIRRNTNAKERIKVCDKVKMSINLLNFLLAQDRNITKDNLKLVKAAFSKAKSNFKKASKLINSI